MDFLYNQKKSWGIRMSRIAVLLPRDFMLEQAKKVIEEEQMEIDILKVIRTADSVYEARKAVDEGADIIVARGIQAAFIKKYTNIPLAEMVLTGQEMGRLIVKAKRVLDRKHPSIAIIGFKNMYSDMTYFEEIFAITLKTYFIEALEESEEAVEQAAGDGAHLIIGGDVVGGLAERRGIPTLFIESTEDSIRNALVMAGKMSYAAEVEKNHIAQFETVLDTSNNGIIQIDEEKKITIVNRLAEEIIGKKSDEVSGKGIRDVIPGLQLEYVDGVLNGKRDTYTTSTRIGKTALMITMTPIQYEEQIRGAILTCYRLTAQRSKDAEQYREMYLHGYIARHHFESISETSEKMKQALEMAKMFALSTKPVLIYGEEGTEKELFAQCIHNNSAYKSGPFVSINCSGMPEQMQLDRLFGNPDSADESMKKGALLLGELGTVLISEVERLSLVAQYRLYRAIQYETLLRNDLEKSQTLDNRIVVTSRTNLGICVSEGTFREDLYYLLTGLTVEIPPLRERTRDIEIRVERCRSEFQKRYSKFLKVSEGAMQELKSYPWPGNEIQLESFCERMFLTTQKKTIYEDYVKQLFDELYPSIELHENEKKMVVYKHPEAIRLAELLEKHQGNRAAVAKELNISTTTLWRHIKKYGVDYS